MCQNDNENYYDEKSNIVKKGNDCNNEKKKVGDLIMVALPKW